MGVRKKWLKFGAGRLSVREAGNEVRGSDHTTAHTALPNLPTPSTIFPTSAVAKLNLNVARSGLFA